MLIGQGGGAFARPVKHAAGPPVCIVYDLRRHTLKVARQALRAGHCRLGRVNSVYSRVGRGRVVKQRPAPGQRAAAQLPRARDDQPRPQALALRLAPVVAGADVDGQRRVELVGGAHLLADELFHRRQLRVRHLQQQLVVHLEDEPRTSPLLPQPVVDAHHRDLDDVRVRALHDEVDREALAE